jgi:hypothetical protein
LGGKTVRIEFERSGGFAGIRLQASLDTQELDSEEASSVEGMIEAVNFFELPERLQTNSGGADRFQYKLTVAADWVTHSVVMGEADVPKVITPLIDRLNALARSQRNSPPKD